MKPTIGRIVHVVEGGDIHLPAIVTQTFFGRDDVTLEVFGKESRDVRQSVEHDESARVGTWHWPERE